MNAGNCNFSKAKKRIFFFFFWTEGTEGTVGITEKKNSCFKQNLSHKLHPLLCFIVVVFVLIDSLLQGPPGKSLSKRAPLGLMGGKGREESGCRRGPLRGDGLILFI